jgi:hypothetical protein
LKRSHYRAKVDEVVKDPEKPVKESFSEIVVPEATSILCYFFIQNYLTNDENLHSNFFITIIDNLNPPSTLKHPEYDAAICVVTINYQKAAFIRHFVHETSNFCFRLSSTLDDFDFHQTSDTTGHLGRLARKL